MTMPPPVELRQSSSSFREQLINVPPDTRQHKPGPGPPTDWAVVRFIVKSPMQCSRLRCYTTLFMGILSSVGVGGCLAAIGISIGGLLTALLNSNEVEFNRVFTTVIVILAVTVAVKTCGEYCMRSVGLWKRGHLNSRLQAM